MDSRAIQNFERRLERLFDLAGELERANRERLRRGAPTDALDEILAHWARYLCILTSGYVEASTQHILKEYAAHANPRVKNYVVKRLGDFQNPKSGPLLDLVGSFDTGWRQTIEAFIAEERKDALNSIVGARNPIAHGMDHSVTMSNVRAWYRSAREIVHELERTVHQ